MERNAVKRSRKNTARLGIIPAIPHPFRVVAKNGILSFIPRYGREEDELRIELSTILKQLKTRTTNGHE